MTTLKQELEHFIIGTKEYDIYHILAENKDILEKLNTITKSSTIVEARISAQTIINLILDDTNILNKFKDETGTDYELALKVENLNDTIVYWLTH